MLGKAKGHYDTSEAVHRSDDGGGCQGILNKVKDYARQHIDYSAVKAMRAGNDPMHVNALNRHMHDEPWCHGGWSQVSNSKLTTITNYLPCLTFMHGQELMHSAKVMAKARNEDLCQGPPGFIVSAMTVWSLATLQTYARTVVRVVRTSIVRMEANEVEAREF